MCPVATESKNSKPSSKKKFSKNVDINLNQDKKNKVIFTTNCTN